MIPIALAIFIYQFIALLGVAGATQTVTYIAYLRRNIDIRLMYSQNAIDLFLNYRKFRKPTSEKNGIVLLVLLTLLFEFIPTIFTKFHTTEYIYYNIASSTLQYDDAINNAGWPGYLSIFENFTSSMMGAQSANISINEMGRGYIKEIQLKNISMNPTGVWYDFKHQPTLVYNNRTLANSSGFFSSNGDPLKSTVIHTFSAFGQSKAGDENHPSSSSLTDCANIPTSNGKPNLVELPDLQNLSVQAIHTYNTACYPVYNKAATISITSSMPYHPSVHSRTDTIYRTRQLVPGVTAMGTSSVSLMNHNATHMTLGIRKMATITLYKYNKTISLPTNCSEADKSSDDINFKNLPYNYIFCQFFKTLSGHSNYTDIQASTTQYNNNYAVNAVYTAQNGKSYEPGQSAMLDLDVFMTLNMEGQLKDSNEECLLAYEQTKFGTLFATNRIFNTSLANDNIGYILNRIDPSIFKESSIEFLAAMASIKARWSQNDYSDFIKYTAHVGVGVETSPRWVASVVLLIILFLLPQLTRYEIKKFPQYSNDLRSILISSVDKSVKDSWEGEFSARQVDIVADDGKQSNAKAVHLIIDGSLIVGTRKNADEDTITDSLIPDEKGVSTSQHEDFHRMY